MLCERWSRAACPRPHDRCKRRERAWAPPTTRFSAFPTSTCPNARRSRTRWRRPPSRRRGAPPLARFTREIRRRLLAVAPAGERWLRRFAGSAESYLHKGVLPANANWARGVVPDIDPYLVQREHDSAVHTCIDLIELAAGLSLSDEVHAAEPLPAMRQLCARALAYANDLMSYEKEVLRHGNPNNLVHVLMVRRSLPFELAVHRVVALINEYTRQLVALEGEILERSPPRAVVRYVAGMRQLLRGNYDWSLATARYRSERSPFPELRPLPRASLPGAAS